MPATRIIGLMSGTSLDGIDAALVRFDDRGPEEPPGWALEAFHYRPYAVGDRSRIAGLIAEGGLDAATRLHADLGEWFAGAALDLCASAGVDPADVDAIGSHGQTVWHLPPEDGRGATLQLGCPATIAERTGIPVVSDFRARDMAAGGQGAPLIAWADRALFAHPERGRVLANIGGIANASHVPAGGRGDVIAFDTGPGNVLIDAAIARATDGAGQRDERGERARRGRVLDDLLSLLLDDPYFGMAPPKSTGRERYGPDVVADLVERVAPVREREWNDILATLTEVTAVSLADGIRRWLLPHGAGDVLVSGGGARNSFLLERLASRLPEVDVVPASAIGMNPDAKEAIAFAALAWAHVHGRTGNEPRATGAAGPRVLGSLTPGTRGRSTP